MHVTLHPGTPRSPISGCLSQLKGIPAEALKKELNVFEIKLWVLQMISFRAVRRRKGLRPSEKAGFIIFGQKRTAKSYHWINNYLQSSHIEDWHLCLMTCTSRPIPALWSNPENSLSPPVAALSPKFT